MGLLEKVTHMFVRKEIVLRAYMIHDKDSHFTWKPELEGLCKEYNARVGLTNFEVIHEMTRLNMMAERLISSGEESSVSISHKLDRLRSVIDSGFGVLGRVFHVRVYVDQETFEKKAVDLEALRQRAFRILEKSEPWYLAAEQ